MIGEKLFLLFLFIVFAAFLIKFDENNPEKIWLSPDTFSKMKKFMVKILEGDFDFQRGFLHNSKIIVCTYSEITDIMHNYNNKIILMLPNHYTLGKKNLLWKNIALYYGKRIASTITPMSYLLPMEHHLYTKDYLHNRNNRNNQYMFKKLAQRQEGLHLTDKYVGYEECEEQQYIIVQKFIPNSLKYQGYPINVRLYLIIKIVGRNPTLQAYLSNDGIISYGIKENKKSDIASFYQSKDLYDKGFPITVQTFFKQTSQSEVNFNHCIDMCAKQAQKMVMACSSNLIGNINYKDHTCCEIFGVDFLITNDYKNAFIIECNICPGMNAHTNIDGTMRKRVLGDFFKFAIWDKYPINWINLIVQKEQLSRSNRFEFPNGNLI